MPRAHKSENLEFAAALFYFWFVVTTVHGRFSDELKQECDE